MFFIRSKLKMTLGGSALMTFGKFFGLFEKYWNYNNQREIRYSDLNHVKNCYYLKILDF